MSHAVQRFRRLLFSVLLIALAAVVTVTAQPLNTQIQIAINQLTTGVTPFTQLALTAGSYISWGATLGVNGYGIRSNAGVIEFKNSGGSWTPLGSGGGAPVDAGYWVRTANSDLTNETIMGALGTGLVINTTTTGVPTIYAGATCTNQFVRALSAIGAATCATVSLTADVTGTLPVGNGGTGLTSGTSGGVLYFNASNTLASSAALTANQIVLGGGAGAAPTVLVPGTTTTLLHGNAAGAPSFSSVLLTADVSGILPGANGGTGNGFFAVSGPATSLKTFTFPNASATVLTDASAITPAQGGTGISSYAVGDLLYASATTVLSKLADVATGNALISGGVTTAPSWGKIGLTTHVSGTLPVANGGTNITSYTIGDLLYASGSSALSKLVSPAAGYTIRSTGVGSAPAWDAVAVRSSITNLTDAQIKALPTTPVTLVAAAGANQVIKLIGYTLITDTGGGAYTNIDAAYADLHIGIDGDYNGYGPVFDNTVTPNIVTFTNILGAAGRSYFDGFAPSTVAIGSAMAAFYVTNTATPSAASRANAPLTIAIENNGTGNLTGGNAANNMRVIVYYIMQDIS